MDMTKPHKGEIFDWFKLPCAPGLGYFIAGRFSNHPQFAGRNGHTSFVVAHEGDEIETRNSRYTLVDPEIRL